MRIRTILAFVVGALTGAATIYLADPEEGSQRRRQTGRWAAAQAREQGPQVAARVLEVGRQVARSAVDGYREGPR